MFFTWKIDRQPYYNQLRQKIKIPTEVGIEGISCQSADGAPFAGYCAGKMIKNLLPGNFSGS